MKRFFKVIAILILLLVGLVVAIPVIFKGEIVEKAKTEINNQVTAKVDFGSVSLSLWSSFPHFEVSVEELYIDGQGDFSGTRLLDLEEFSMEIDLMSVLFGSQFEIRSIEARDMELRLLTLEDGRVNYDIMVAEGESGPADTSSSRNFTLALQSYAVRNFDFYYEDRAADMYFEAIALNHEGQGDFTQNIVDMRTTTSAESMLFRMENVNYLNRIKAQADFDFIFDQQAFSFRFGDNRVQLNDLGLNFTGNFSMPQEDMVFDMSFSAPKNDFKDLISLIPAYYYQDFEELETQGTFDFNGQLTGHYNGDKEEYPQFDLQMGVADGQLNYPSLPSAVKDISLDLRLKNERADLDGITVNVADARATVAENPITAKFYLANPMSNPRFQLDLKGLLDLASLEKVVPMVGYQYRGTIDADMHLKTDLASIEQERYQDVEAQGYFRAQDLQFSGDSLPYRIRIAQALMEMSPQQVNLPQLDLKIDETHFFINGHLDNMLAYALSDEVLKGRFTLKAPMIEVADLMPQTEDGGTASATDTSALSVIRVPKNIQFNFRAEIDTLVYDDMEIKELSGSLVLNEGVMQLQDLVLALLGGQVRMNGAYNSALEKPRFTADLQLKDFPFQKSFEQFSLLQKLGSIAQYTEGTFSAQMTMASTLGGDMLPDLSTVDAEGSLSTSRLQTGGKTLEKIAEALNNPEYGRLRLAPLDLGFSISNGTLRVDPFDIKAGSVKAEVSGATTLDQQIDYEVLMELPLSGIKGGSLLDKIGGTGGTAKVKLDITGTATQPKVSTSLQGTAEDLLNQAKAKVTEKVEAVKEEAKKAVNDKAQELIDQAEAKGDQLIAEAKRKGEQLKAEAKRQADKIRAEADKRAQQIEDEAEGNFLKEKAAQISAKKIREEAEKRALQIEQEAAKQADQLVQAAQNEKEKLVADARAKAQI